MRAPAASCCRRQSGSLFPQELRYVCAPNQVVHVISVKLKCCSMSIDAAITTAVRHNADCVAPRKRPMGSVLNTNRSDEASAQAVLDSSFLSSFESVLTPDWSLLSTFDFETESEDPDFAVLRVFFNCSFCSSTALSASRWARSEAKRSSRLDS